MATVGTRPRLALALVTLLLGSLPVVGCKKKEASTGGLEDVAATLLNVRVGGSPIEMRVPPAWIVRDIDPGPVPARPEPVEGEPPVIKLTGRLLFEARAPVGDRSDNTAVARIELFHDPWLPVGTSARDYLEAQRSQNEQAIKQGKPGSSRIRHVEAERSRRQGRPTYHVRDEWTFKFLDQKATVSQESLLLIDKMEADLHGYTVVMTLTDADLEDLERVRRAVIDSIRFAKN